jgi:deoxyribonuclease (pyrimidine dimer)
MTRINCVPPQELSRQHLLAEWKELPRVFTLAAKAYHAGRKVAAPEQYTLGAGHVKFFYKRLTFCTQRFYQLRREMLRRGYNVSYDAPPLTGIVEKDWWGHWVPDGVAMQTNRARIAERSKQHVRNI